MATIKQRGDSYKITVSCGYDLNGKQIRRHLTWTPEPVHIAGLFANIAAEGRLAATVKMFASLYGIIIVLQLLYILSQFVLASGVCRKNHLKSIKNIAPAYFTALGTQSSASTIPVALN